MLVAEFVTRRPEMSSNRTAEDFYKFLGTNTKRLGVVSRMYPNLTMSYLTEGLGNIYYNDKQPKKFQPIDSLVYEWDVDIDFIKKVELAAAPEGTGEGGSEIIFAFKEHYYDKNDTFIIEKSRQQCFVLAAPVRRADNYWEYSCQLIDPDFQSILDPTLAADDTTRFVSNYHPEMSEEGYTKYQSSAQKHRNYISMHRNDVNYSSLYAIQEDTFVKISKGQNNGQYGESLFKMKKAELNCLESFLVSRNNGMLVGKSNYDINGKCTVTDRATGRPIPMGDGVIPQIERYAGKYGFNTLTPAVFDTAIAMMAEKAETPMGNNFTFICTERMMQLVQRCLREYLAAWKTSATFLYSQKGGKVNVGATYASYEFMGNQITFQVDRALTLEYGAKAMGLFVDLTSDKTSGTPAIQMFSLEGLEFRTNKIAGVGGLDGRSSGVVSSPVAASKIVNWGYAGVAVFNPYRSFILFEN